MPRPGFRSSIGIGERRILLLAPLCLLLLAVAVQEQDRLAYLGGYMAGFVLLVLGLELASREVFEIDTTRRNYHKTRSALALTGPDWLPLPTVSAVVVKYFSHYHVSSRRRLRSEKPVRHYIVLLSVAGSATGLVVHKYGYRQQAEAQQVAAHLAAYLNVPQRLFDGPE